MLQRLWMAVLAVMLLGGCGRGGEDFTVRIARPPERVMQALGHAGLDSDLAEHFSGLKLERTEPTRDEVVYTIPGDASFPAVIHFTFEPVDGGKGTIVHAAVDVPAVKVEFDKKTKVISETKVEAALREIVQQTGSKLEEGSDTVEQRKDMAQLLTALAIVTDSKQLALAKDIERNPDRYMGGLDSLYDGDEGGDAPEGPRPAFGSPAVGEDPNAAVRDQEHSERDRAADAAAPMNDAKGDDPRAGGNGDE